MKTAMIKPNYHLVVLFIAVMAFLLCAWPISGKTALGSSNVSEIGVLENTVSKSLTALGKSIAYRSRALGNSNVPESIANTNSSDSVNSSTPGGVDAEAGLNQGSVRFDGSASSHETLIANELSDGGSDVVVRGTNVEGPDALINGINFEFKEVTGNGTRALQNNIRSAQSNFSTDAAQNLGLSRADTRAVIDVRGSNTWNNPASVQSELNRLSNNGTLNNVQELKIVTSSGVITWKPTL